MFVQFHKEICVDSDKNDIIAHILTVNGGDINKKSDKLMKLIF